METFPIIHPLKGRISASEIDENEALLILSAMPSLGPVRIRGLLRHFGSARQALFADSHAVEQLCGAKIAAHWQTWGHNQVWKSNLELIAESGVQLIGMGTPEYPERLFELNDPPPLLYVKGSIAKASKRCIAIVGTRQASLYGNEMAKAFAESLAAAGFVVISGLARGIDTAAHDGALQAGETIAVIGSGLGNIYPAENRQLAEYISQTGCLVSEFPMATPPDRQNFPQRNRLVAAMSIAILLIEAPLKSGAMLTMEMGANLQRRLFALPGRVDNKNFCGNHMLIKRGRAQLVESPTDILATYDDFFGLLERKTEARMPMIPLDKEEEKLLQSFPSEEISIDALAHHCQQPMSTLNMLLMSLVLKGLVTEFPGKLYKKCTR